MLKLALWLAGLLGIGLLVLYAFAFDVWTVPADDPVLAASLAPTLDPGDVVILTRHPLIVHGYLLRCPDPEAPGRFVVARAIAQGGETVSFSDEMAFVDGHHSPSPQVCNPPSVVVGDPRSGLNVELTCAVEEYGEMNFSVLRATNPAISTKTPRKVGPGTWFLVSDNRHFPLDSRDYGPIDQRLCQHVVLRVKGHDGIGASLIW
jgi:signal peptidase I